MSRGRPTLWSALGLLAFADVASAGALVPLPQRVACAASSLSLDARSFAFSTTGVDSTLLQDALQRYASIAFVPALPALPLNMTTSPVAGTLTALAVNVLSADETLSIDTNESYELVLPTAGGAATLECPSVFGCMRGLDTFSQLVDFVGDSAYIAPACAVSDWPRFAHRGALLDTARHFLPVSILLAFVDALAYNKLNVLHWHIVDDQAFPYYSEAFPDLSGLGAFGAPDDAHVYSRRDVSDVIAYARARGVRTVVEFDLPGHSQSWGHSQTGLLAQCYDKGVPVRGSFGPIDPTVDSTWTFLTAFWAEVAKSFPDAYIHVGGDEVSFECWQSNPQIAAWMTARGWADYALLESYFVQRNLNILSALGKSVIGWQELVDNNLTLPEATVVTAWRGGAAAGPAEMARITAAGHKALLSAGWYLNYIAYGVQWPSYYELDPANFTGTSEQIALVLGGELACWGEFVDSVNVVSRMFPYGSAVAERL